ncbi:MAG: oligosaccharide flippase family protein [Crocinitomicaceae bacterium]|nr:oligosaccharide flippase family protein [Flavobacteriales bacterium]NQZ35015.1 oligosaccharide flippase family protein [Crocinitomicaceae bacterium]
MKFTKDTIWLIGAQVVVMGSALFINLLIGYEYGTASLGIFNQAFSFYIIFSTLFSLGLNNSLIKKIAEKTRNLQQENRLFTVNISTTFIFSLLFSLLLKVITVQFPQLFSSAELVDALHIQIFALPLFSINRTFGAYYSGNRRQMDFALQRIFRWFGIATSMYIGASQGLELTFLMYSFVFIEGLIFIFNGIKNRRHFDFHFNLELVRENLSFGMGSYISEITSVFNSSIDIILVAYFLTQEDAGKYSFIVFFIRTLYVFPGIIMQNISPIVSRYWATNMITKLNDKLKKLRVINIIVLSVQLLMLLGLYKFVIMNVKQGFENTYTGFLIACVGTFMFAQISWGGSILIMTNKLRLNFYRTLSVLAINVLLLSVLTYNLGFNGSVIAISANGLVSFLLLKSFVYRQTGIRLI